MIEQEAKGYIEYLTELWPLALLCGGASFVFGMTSSINSFKMNNWRQYLIQLIFKSITASLFVLVIVPVVPYLIKEFPILKEIGLTNVQIEVAVSLIVSFIGIDTVYYLLKKRFGLVTLDEKEREDKALQEKREAAVEEKEERAIERNEEERGKKVNNEREEKAQ